MLIGAWSKEDGETPLLMVKGTLTRSLEDYYMCLALTLGLYLVEHHRAIVEDKLDGKTMKKIVKKYLSRWHTLA